MFRKLSLTRSTTLQLFAEVYFSLHVNCILNPTKCLCYMHGINGYAFSAYNKALEDALAVLDKISMSIDVNDRKLCHNPIFSYISYIFMCTLLLNLSFKLNLSSL